jgi:hypothetical protein
MGVEGAELAWQWIESKGQRLTDFAVQIRKLSFHIVNSPTRLLPAWHAVCHAHHLRRRLIPRDVATRWNSTFDMLEFAVAYWPAISSVTGDLDNDLRKFELSNLEWSMLEELASNLKVCWHSIVRLRLKLTALQLLKDATLVFSQGSPLLAQVIPAMDKVDRTFADAIKAHATSQPIKAALTLAKSTMNAYYSRTDRSSTYRIAMGVSHAHTILLY